MQHLKTANDSEMLNIFKVKALTKLTRTLFWPIKLKLIIL